MNSISFEAFQAQKLAQGYDEVLIRTWEPETINATHTHPFDTDALVVHGEYWLTCDGQTRHLKTGDTFTLARNKEHAEKYGPQGCVFWAARKL